MMTCPQPEAAVNDPERSMVSRIKRRSSRARALTGPDLECGRRRRWGRGSGMVREEYRLWAEYCQVLCDAKLIGSAPLQNTGAKARLIDDQLHGPRRPALPRPASICTITSILLGYGRLGQ